MFLCRFLVIDCNLQILKANGNIIAYIYALFNYNDNIYDLSYYQYIYQKK